MLLLHKISLVLEPTFKSYFLIILRAVCTYSQDTLYLCSFNIFNKIKKKFSILAIPYKDFCLWFLNLIMVGIIREHLMMGKPGPPPDKLKQTLRKNSDSASRSHRCWRTGGEASGHRELVLLTWKTTHCVCETKEDSEVKRNTVRRQSWNLGRKYREDFDFALTWHGHAC